MIPFRALLFALALSAAACPTARAEDAPTYQITFAQREGVAVDYQAVKRLIVFRANLAGREVWALLDNGAKASLVDEAFAREVGLPLAPTQGTAMTPAGPLFYRQTRDVPLNVAGAFKTTLPRAAAVDLSGFSKDLGRRIDFVLGRDLLRNTGLVIDPGRKVFRLAAAGALKPGDKAPSLDLIGEPEMVEVSIGAEKAWLMIDFGSSSTITLTPEAWARVAPGRPATGARTERDMAGRQESAATARLPRVKIGPVDGTDVETAIRPWPVAKSDGVLGMGFFMKVQILMDISQGKLWMLPPTPPDPSRPAP